MKIFHKLFTSSVCIRKSLNNICMEINCVDCVGKAETVLNLIDTKYVKNRRGSQSWRLQADRLLSCCFGIIGYFGFSYLASPEWIVSCFLHLCRNYSIIRWIKDRRMFALMVFRCIPCGLHLCVLFIYALRSHSFCSQSRVPRLGSRFW